MRFTVKRITPILLYRADGGEDFLCEGYDEPAEQTQEALGTLACVMALDRHTDLHDLFQRVVGDSDLVSTFRLVHSEVRQCSRTFWSWVSDPRHIGSTVHRWTAFVFGPKTKLTAALCRLHRAL